MKIGVETSCNFLPLRDLPDVLASVAPMNVGGHAGAVLAQKMRVAVVRVVAPLGESIEGEKETWLLLVLGVIRQHLSVTKHEVKNVLEVW